MNKANTADFSKTSPKALTDPLDLSNQPCCTRWFMADGFSTWWSGNIRPGMRSPSVSWATWRVWAAASRRYGIWWLQQIGKRSRPHPVYQEFLLRSSDSTGYGPLHPKSEVFGQKHCITVDQCDNDADTRLWVRHWLLLQTALLK